MSDIGVVIDLDDETIERSKVILDYTSRDFTAIRSQLVGLARGLMPEWQTAGEASDFGTLLLELFAYMGDVMHFYIDRTASEAFLGTALRRQSVLYIADMMGYVPVGQQAASVTLTFTIQSEDPDAPGLIKRLTIPKGTRVYNEASNADDLVVFELAGDVTLDPKVPISPTDPDLREVIAYANEGVSVFDRPSGSSLGSPNTEIVIPDKGVISGTVRVQTREGSQVLLWGPVAHLSSASPTQAVFTTYMDEQGLTHIIFGDNAAGRVPPINAEFFVSYRYGVGSRANDLPSNSIKGIANVPNVDLTGVEMTNRSSPIGGTDPESIDSMRFSVARGGSRLRSRAVTLNDYAELAMQVPGVAKSVAWGTVYTAVHVRVAPVDGKADANYMDRLLKSVSSYMQDKIMVGSSVYPEPANVDDLWQDVYIQVLVHVMDAYDRTVVRLQVEQVVRQLLHFDVVDFGYRVSIGLIYRAVLAVQGVEWAELTWLNTSAPVDDTAPGEGDTITIAAAVWQHNNSTDTTSDPGNKHYRRDSATNPAVFAFSSTDDDNGHPNLAALQIGDHLIYRPVQDVSSWMSFVVTGVPDNSAHPTWFQIQVLKIDQATPITAPGNNDKVMFSVVRYTPTPDSLGGVMDIETDELLIPRITPPLSLADPSTVTNKVLASNVATLTTASPHDLVPGDVIDVTGVPGTSEVQTVTPTGTITGGSFTMTLLGVTTGSIPWNATNAQIQTAINTAIPNNTITVAGGPVNTTAFTLTYTGSGDVAQVTIAASLSGTGPTLTPTTTTVGVSADVFNGTRLSVIDTTDTTVSYPKTNANVVSAAVTSGTITQVDPARPESEVDYPDLTEEERTHDGLWVKAVGGLVNT